MRIAQHLGCMWFLSPWGWLGVRGVFDAVKTGRGEFANSLTVQDVLHCRFFEIFLGHWVFFLDERVFLCQSRRKEICELPSTTVQIYFLDISGQSLFCFLSLGI